MKELFYDNIKLWENISVKYRNDIWLQEWKDYFTYKWDIDKQALTSIELTKEESTELLNNWLTSLGYDAIVGLINLNKLKVTDRDEYFTTYSATKVEASNYILL